MSLGIRNKIKMLAVIEPIYHKNALCIGAVSTPNDPRFPDKIRVPAMAAVDPAHVAARQEDHAQDNHDVEPNA